MKLNAMEIEGEIPPSQRVTRYGVIGHDKEITTHAVQSKHLF